jgi:hypothetical protein
MSKEWKGEIDFSEEIRGDRKRQRGRKELHM